MSSSPDLAVHYSTSPSSPSLSSPTTTTTTTATNRIVLNHIYAKQPKGLLARAAAWTASTALPGSTSTSTSNQSPTLDITHGPPQLQESTKQHNLLATKLYNCSGSSRPAHVLAVFPSVVQLWSVSAKDTCLSLVFSIDAVSVVDAHLVTPTHCLVQSMSANGQVSAAVYSVQTSSLVETLDIPPSCPPPYKVEAGQSCFAIAGSNGQVCLYSSHSFARSTLSPKVALSDASCPIFTLAGRWLAYQPSASDPLDTTTPVNLPPAGPLHERIMESVSSNAVASLKSLSDKGYRGFCNYFRFQDEAMSSSASSSSTSSSSSRKSSLEKLRLIFASTRPICIVDIPTGKSIASFVPLGSVSKISLSPYDLTLAAVPSRGDCIYTYDLSTAPSSITLTGKYIRGKVNALVDVIQWGPVASLGIVSQPRGSVHWFDKSRSFDDASHRLWKLSGWKASEIAIVDPHRVLVSTATGQLYICDIEDGHPIASGQLHLGSLAFPANHSPSPTPPSSYSSTESLDALNTKYHTSVSRSASPVLNPTASSAPPDPLAFFELETCLPYPFIHTDRHVTISTFTHDASEYMWTNDLGNICLKTFGASIPRVPLDFGKPTGTADVYNNTDLKMALQDYHLDDLDDQDHLDHLDNQLIDYDPCSQDVLDD